MRRRTRSPESLGAKLRSGEGPPQERWKDLPVGQSRPSQCGAKRLGKVRQRQAKPGSAAA